MGFLDKLVGKPMSKADFAATMAKAMQRHGASVKAIDVQEFRLVLADNSIANLDNVYAQYVNARSQDRDKLIENFAAASTAKNPLPAKYDDAKKNLMPVVRAASYNSLMDLQLRLSGKPDEAERAGLRGAQQAFAEDLVVGLAFDTEKSFTHVNDRQVHLWGVTFAQALSDALENLRRRTKMSEIQEEGPGAFAGRWKDSYESSRVLLTDVVYRAGTGSEPVCFIPTRDDFWVASRRDAPAIHRLLRASEEKHFAAYGLSPAPLVLVDECWEPFTGDDAASQALIRTMRLKRGAMEYAQQKQLLDECHKREGKEMFVASCMAPQGTEPGAMTTLSVWSKGVPTLLPKTERIVLMIDPVTKDHLQARWEDVEREVGELMREEPGLLPKRYRVETFPDEGTIETLRRISAVPA